MSTSRDNILNKLRAAQAAIPQIPAVEHHAPMVPLASRTADDLATLFIQQAQKLGSKVYSSASQTEALDTILGLLGDDISALCWPFEHIPLTDLEAALQSREIAVAQFRDPSVRVGITGVDSALAATGSLVLSTGGGKHRVTSLLPLIHIAVVSRQQVIADFETWVAMQRVQGDEAFRQSASTIVITGPSRTADIAMQLTMGMHGPAELHIILAD